MAIKRFRPIQDAFVEEGVINAGLDEILELGPKARILIQFMPEEIKAVLRPLHGAPFKAVLHIFAARAENLSPMYGIEAYPCMVPWEEGTGHINDMYVSTPGVTWDPSMGEETEWPAAPYMPVKKEIPFTRYQLNRDVDLDITEFVEMWATETIENNGLIIKFQDEEKAAEYGSKIFFYSNETHTTFFPYIDIIWDDSKHESGDKPEVEGQFTIIPKNLRREYRLGEKTRIDLDARPLYPKRVYSTSSLYENRYTCPDNKVLWGIQDSFTGEIVVDFDRIGTRVSRDSQGSFFILDTDLLLEPEREYRLMFGYADPREGSRYLCNSRNTFRIIRYGEVGL